jgi:hypothetical protein
MTNSANSACAATDDVYTYAWKNKDHARALEICEAEGTVALYLFMTSLGSNLFMTSVTDLWVPIVLAKSLMLLVHHHSRKAAGCAPNISLNSDADPTLLSSQH